MKLYYYINLDERGEFNADVRTEDGDTTTGDWGYQTGDNSYTGGAYDYPDWAVVTVYRRSNSIELARDIRDQLSELFYS